MPGYWLRWWESNQVVYARALCLCPLSSYSSIQSALRCCVLGKSTQQYGAFKHEGRGKTENILKQTNYFTYLPHTVADSWCPYHIISHQALEALSSLQASPNLFLHLSLVTETSNDKRQTSQHMHNPTVSNCIQHWCTMAFHGILWLCISLSWQIQWQTCLKRATMRPRFDRFKGTTAINVWGPWPAPHQCPRSHLPWWLSCGIHGNPAKCEITRAFLSRIFLMYF